MSSCSILCAVLFLNDCKLKSGKSSSWKRELSLRMPYHYISVWFENDDRPNVTLNSDVTLLILVLLLRLWLLKMCIYKAFQLEEKMYKNKCNQVKWKRTLQSFRHFGTFQFPVSKIWFRKISDSTKPSFKLSVCLAYLEHIHETLIIWRELSRFLFTVGGAINKKALETATEFNSS